MRVLALFLVLFLTACQPSYQRASQSVVKLLRADGHGGGTGFEVRTPHDRVFTITNAHMCRDGAISAQIGDRLIPLRVIEVSEATDLCLLDAIEWIPALKPAWSEPEAGETIHTYGFGMLLPLTHTSGEYVGRVGGPVLGVFNPAYLTATILPGNSGSPVVNSVGRLVGVVYATGSILNDRALVVPLDDIHAFLQPY